MKPTHRNPDLTRDVVMQLPDLILLKNTFWVNISFKDQRKVEIVEP
jgi:hypothetical protein